MRLSWSEIRVRAATFADEWRDARYEKGDTHSFYNDLFEVFGVKRRRVAYFEQRVKLLDARLGFIDLFWPRVLIVEQKSAGRNLSDAKDQALAYFPGIAESELPRFILVSDFQSFELHDLEEGGLPIRFALSDLPGHVEAFGFILGVQKRTFKDQDPVNIEASELMGKLHDELKRSGYEGHDLERLLVRLLFCLFADDTGIFNERDVFDSLVRDRTERDGSDLGSKLSQLFEVLNTPEDRRQRALPAELTEFPYVNGDLFAERLPIPAFDTNMRAQLLEACEFSWDAISPAIFGSLFQSVMNKKQRRAQGAHYTTEKNILKVIEPLFLDELRAEFARLRVRRDTGRISALKAYQNKLASLRFLDPACGCGNFLIIAYRELRGLEIEVLKETRRATAGGGQLFDVAGLAKVNVDQFYGIELGEFPARIAEVAMWMMDHIMNNRLSLEFGEVYARIPLTVSPHIRHGDALEIDWVDVLKAEECNYVFGNPPFVGAKKQTERQRGQVRRIANLGGTGGTLDYVSAWFLKAGGYARAGEASIGFVATNSITQGEQVAQLWPLLFDRCGFEIAFAHRTFAWGSDARGVAHVHCVIVGLTQRARERSEKRLFSYEQIDGDPVETQHDVLAPYLIDASKLGDKHLVVKETTRPVSAVPEITFGNMPNDGGHLIVEPDVRAEVLADEPELVDLLRPLVGAHDMINGEQRFCLWLRGVRPDRVRASPFIMDRIGKVRVYRLASTRAATRRLGNSPMLFGEIRHRDTPSIIIPRHSSERRSYVPMMFSDGRSIAHDSCLFLPNATLFDLGVLTSAMHMSWLRNVGGRIKNDFRYSATLVLNTYPWPNSERQSVIASLAQGVIDARALFPASTLADLYDPLTMPSDLRRAHTRLDAAVDRLYRPTPFTSDRERVEHLFGLYEKLVAPLAAAARAKLRRGGARNRP